MLYCTQIPSSDSIYAVCFIDDSQYNYEETENDNIIEPEAPITTRRPGTHSHTHSIPVVSTEQMCKHVFL